MPGLKYAKGVNSHKTLSFYKNKQTVELINEISLLSPVCMPNLNRLTRHHKVKQARTNVQHMHFQQIKN